MTQPVIDTDGMPISPKIALTSHNGAYSIFRTALDQAIFWHPPTQQEKQSMLQLLTNFHLSTINGISKITTRNIIQAADELGLQVNRVKTFKTVNSVKVPDSYLLVYTKPGVKDYSGPFLMLRETKRSKVVIISPHDDSDGTAINTKLGMSESYALACISNGHKRGKIGEEDYRDSDFVHSKNNLGTYTVEQFCNLFPGTVCMQIHGIAHPTKCMFRSRHLEMGNIFREILIKNTRLKQEDFVDFPVSFTIDNLIKSNHYIKCEIPAVIHKRNKAIIKLISLEFEKNNWTWKENEME